MARGAKAALPLRVAPALFLRRFARAAGPDGERQIHRRREEIAPTRRSALRSMPQCALAAGAAAGGVTAAGFAGAWLPVP